jgi:rod shape-determining protein MreC
MRQRYQKRLIWAGIAPPLVLVALFFLVFAEPINKKDGFFSSILTEFSLPFQKVFHDTLVVTKGSWERYIFLVGVAEENAHLKKQNAVLAHAAFAYKEKEAELYRLQRLLSLRELKQHKHIGARVISKTSSPTSRVLTIDQGLTSGVQAGLAVISPEGIVGKIVEVSWHTARVLLITDFRSNVDALVQESRAAGVLQGITANRCRLKYVSLSENVGEGNLVLSSGLDGVYPKGLALGVVKSVEKQRSGFSQNIEVAPAVDISKLEEVVVLIEETRI